jgi:hypothetical protein
MMNEWRPLLGTAEAGTYVDVSFALPEFSFIAGSTTHVDYHVLVTIEDVGNGAIVSPCYVSGKTINGFRINLSADPGAGKTVSFGYQLWRN